jgi:hypothetical protein
MPEYTNATKRRPVFFKIPSNWAELTQAEKDAWSLDFLNAAIEAADPEDRPQLDAQPEP